MALDDLYVTVDEIRDYLEGEIVGHQLVLDAAVLAASRGVETFCRRVFNKANAATPRRYRVDDDERVSIDDLHTTTDLTVETDDDGDGTFETTWDASEYELEPLDGVVDGQSGWPLHTLRAVDSRRWPCGGRRARLRVTAQWGWATVPAPVYSAALIVAAEMAKLPEAPLGVAGYGEMGVVRVRSNPMAASKLAPYVRDPILVGG